MHSLFDLDKPTTNFCYQIQALITALRLGRTTWLGSMYDSTDLVDNYYNNIGR